MYADKFRQGQEVVFSKSPVWFLDPPNISIELSEAMSPRVRLPGPEADHSLPSSVEVKSEWRYSSLFPICLHGVERDNFICTSVFVYSSHWNIFFKIIYAFHLYVLY